MDQPWIPRRTTARRVLRFLSFVLLGGLLALAGLRWATRHARAALAPWHTDVLATEFSADQASATFRLEDYLAAEDSLFSELAQWVADDPSGAAPLSRFNPSSPTNPLNLDPNWNRTFRLRPPGAVRGGALLLHGLSDSPYSMRALGKAMADSGFIVVGLRLPGHGTTPAGLSHVSWEDWRAAVRIGAMSVAQETPPGAPFVMVGYSSGAALALEYTLEALDDPELAPPDRLVFLSPAFAVTRLAALARWQTALGRVPGLGDLLWSEIEPEYDPYKYNSFAINAAAQIYRLTSRIEARLNELERAGRLTELPPALAFQSVVDATVPAIASLSRLYGRIGSAESELVLFDVNRLAQIRMFLNPTVNEVLEVGEWSEGEGFPFRLTLVTNASDTSAELVSRDWNPDAHGWEEKPLDLAWPPSVFSLSHVALPFPPDDPIYGIGDGTPPHPFPFGALEPRGERGILTVPVALLTRLRYNPFFDYLAARVAGFIQEASPG